MAADGSSVRRLTTTPANETLPAWSPDGTEIAFLSFQDDLESLDADASPAEIKIMQADGSGVQTLTTPAAPDRRHHVVPDGERVAFAAQDNIHVMRADGTQRHVLTDAEGDEDWPSWSPDGETHPRHILQSGPRAAIDDSGGRVGSDAAAAARVRRRVVA